jgi:hypothetical protein
MEHCNWFTEWSAYHRQFGPAFPPIFFWVKKFLSSFSHDKHLGHATPNVWYAGSSFVVHQSVIYFTSAILQMMGPCTEN